MSSLSPEERAALNAMAVKGQMDAARAIERLIMDGETVLIVTTAGGMPKIDIEPPRAHSPLWRDAATWRTTFADITFVAVRFGCRIRWALSRAEAAALGIGRPKRRVH